MFPFHSHFVSILIPFSVCDPTVAGRGIGCGRISEYRLLMDQLVPASYLQLEDTVRNIALNMRLAGNPPVLNYKRLRYGRPYPFLFKPLPYHHGYSAYSSHVTIKQELCALKLPP